MNWFRFYHEALDDPKVQRLEPWLFKQWVNLLCLAARGEPRGTLPRFEEVAFALRLAEEEADRAISRLLASGLLERVDGLLAPHGWSRRQFASDDAYARVKRLRQRETFHETDQGNVSDTADATGNVSRSVSPSVSVVKSSLSRKEEENMRERGGETFHETDQGNGSAPRPQAAPKPRAARLPDPFEITDPMWDFADRSGLDRGFVRAETEKFVDHFRGSGAAKADWVATWRNWLRRSAEYAPRTTGKPYGNGAVDATALVRDLEAAERRNA